MNDLNVKSIEQNPRNTIDWENQLTSYPLDNECKRVENRNQSKVFETFLLFIALFSLGIGYSILAPFFPTKAKAHGVSEFWIGMIVAHQQLTKLFVSPFIGKYSSKLDPKIGLSIGLIIAGFGNFLMGYLEWSPIPLQTNWYILLAMIFRTIEGVGTSLAWIYNWSIVFIFFEDNISKYIALLHTFYALGIMMGPGLGGIIYEIGENYFKLGFSLTFCLIGVLLMSTALIIQIYFPKSDIQQKIEERVSILRFLKCVGYVFGMFVIIDSSFLIGLNDATLDLHLSNITQLSSTSKGGIFLLFGMSYVAFSQVFGYICDKLQHNYWICMSGAVITSLSFVILGPLPFIPIDSNIPLVITGNILLGAGAGIQLIATFSQMYREIIIKSGLPKNKSTLGLLGALNGSSYAIGFTIGPVIGGLLLDQTRNYRLSTVPIFSLQILLVFSIIVFKLFFNKK